VGNCTTVLAKGRVLIEGESKKVAGMDEVRHAYLGL
jgi:ABC-type branched-subunit amino acid transport system ATPase component